MHDIYVWICDLKVLFCAVTIVGTEGQIFLYSREGVGLQSVFGSVICAVFFIAEYTPFVHIAVGDVAENVEEFTELYDIAVFSEYVF